MDRYKKLLWLIFKENTEGCDIYHNSGSIWLIFTDEKRWVIELTKEGTLWYNYYFFKDCFRLLSLDVTKNQNYITEWVVEKIQNEVKYTDGCQIGISTSIEDTIQNGVKNTQAGNGFIAFEVEDTIQNGVKETFLVEGTRIGIVENTIQNGIKETKHNLWDAGLAMEEAIQNGVKETYGQKHKPLLLGDVIQNGVKETQWRRVDNHPTYLDRIIKN